jgi:hypothetical protein
MAAQCSDIDFASLIDIIMVDGQTLRVVPRVVLPTTAMLLTFP